MVELLLHGALHFRRVTGQLATSGANTAMLIDTHAHLDFPEFASDLDGVIQRAVDAGVDRIVTIGTTLKASRKSVQLAERYLGVYASIGVHPNSASEERSDFIREFRELLQHPKVVAIGETGLDFYRLPSDAAAVESEKAAQLAAFAQHLEFAATSGKSVVIHQRDSWDETLKILSDYAGRIRAVIHCFNGSPAQARQAFELGFFVSFTGIVTFKNAKDVREAATLVPIDQIMVETDAPYLAPVPYRGKRCEPAFVKQTNALIAGLRGLQPEVFGAQTTRNAEVFFGLK
jgi:TatD DNase family protein